MERVLSLALDRGASTNVLGGSPRTNDGTVHNKMSMESSALSGGRPNDRVPAGTIGSIKDLK
jgi:hypothetical protein